MFMLYYTSIVRLKKLARSFNSRSAIEMMSIHWIILGLVISLIVSIPMSLKQRIPQIQIGHTLTYTSKLTVRGG
jgi:hypothetical protein